MPLRGLTASGYPCVLADRAPIPDLCKPVASWPGSTPVALSGLPRSADGCGRALGIRR